MSIKNILIGVSGGIAAYKIPFLVRLLVKAGYSVKVVLTTSAEGLVGVDALRTVSSNPVYQDRVGEYDMNHIRLEEWADLYLIAPATANTIAKITHGIADNLLSTLFLSVKVPVLVAPAMNVNMWENSATQSNITTLKERGVSVLPVGFGELACGVVAAGRMVEPEDLLSYIKLAPYGSSLKGERVLVVSGPTEESIDPVRVITNRSSGKMGNALVRAATAMGAEVTMISGPASTPKPSGVTLLSVNSALDMFNAVKSEINGYTTIVMVAAVSDYRVESISESKISREDSGEITLKLIQNPDISKWIGSNKSDNQILITFALESGSSQKALEKMERKGSDFSVYNHIEDSLEKSSSKVEIFSKNGSSLSVIGSKEKCALEILTFAIKQD